MDRATAPQPLLRSRGKLAQSLARPLNGLRWKAWERRVSRRHLELSNGLYERIRARDPDWLSELI